MVSLSLGMNPIDDDINVMSPHVCPSLVAVDTGCHGKHFSKERNIIPYVDKGVLGACGERSSSGLGCGEGRTGQRCWAELKATAKGLRRDRRGGGAAGRAR